MTKVFAVAALPRYASYNPGQNYLRIFTPPCTLCNTTTLFQKQLICGTKFPFPQVNVVSYKCLRIRVALEHTTTLLPRGGGKGGRGTARMLGKRVWECDIFSTVLSKIVDHVLVLLICAISNINVIKGTTNFFASCAFRQIGTVTVLKLHVHWHVVLRSLGRTAKNNTRWRRSYQT